MSVYLLATLDTKATEAVYVRDQLKSWQIPVLLVDTGSLGEPAVAADVDRRQLFAAAGTTQEAVAA
jgi:uncharacterized protein (UPF0261 family)